MSTVVALGLMLHWLFSAEEPIDCQLALNEVSGSKLLVVSLNQWAAQELHLHLSKEGKRPLHRHSVTVYISYTLLCRFNVVVSGQRRGRL